MDLFLKKVGYIVEREPQSELNLFWLIITLFNDNVLGYLIYFLLSILVVCFVVLLFNVRDIGVLELYLVFLEKSPFSSLVYKFKKLMAVKVPKVTVGFLQNRELLILLPMMKVLPLLDQIKDLK